MAITFHSIPNNYSTSDNPLGYVFSSNQTAQANFSYRVQTILNGSIVSEDKIFPEVSTRGHFDCSSVVLNLMQKPRITEAISTALDTIYTLQLKVIEFYGVTPIEQANATSTSIYTFKAALPPKEWEVIDFETDYLDLKWLTDAPSNLVKIIRGADVICAMLNSGTLTLTIRFYDSSGALLYSFNQDDFHNYRQLNLSSSNMASIYFGAGTYDDVARFEVSIGTSEILTFIYVDDYCDDVHEVVWLNKFGTFDQFPIEHNVIETFDVEARSYKKKYGAWSGINYEYSADASGSIDFEKTITGKGTLVTSYMTDTVQNWLVSVYDSPQAYLYSIAGLLFRLNLKNKSHRYKQGKYDDLIMEEMDYDNTMPTKSIKL